jgi:hypothetical protein
MIGHPARQTSYRSDPKRAIAALGQRVNLPGGQPVGRAEHPELPPVVAEESVLGAHPEESRTILQDGIRVQVGQTIILAVQFETVALGEQWARRKDQAQQSRDGQIPHWSWIGGNGRFL